jgi:hypothetical protein
MALSILQAACLGRTFGCDDVALLAVPGWAGGRIGGARGEEAPTDSCGETLRRFLTYELSQSVILLVPFPRLSAVVPPCEAVAVTFPQTLRAGRAQRPSLGIKCWGRE